MNFKRSRKPGSVCFSRVVEFWRGRVVSASVPPSVVSGQLPEPSRPPTSCQVASHRTTQSFHCHWNYDIIYFTQSN